VLATLKALVRDIGVLPTGLYITSRLLSRLSPNWAVYYYRIVLQPVQKKSILPPHRGNAFHFRVLKAPADILDQLPRPKKVIATRFDQGGVCIAATLNGTFVGCIWLQMGAYLEDEVRAVFSPATPHIAWDYDVYICESQRKGFLFVKLWDRAADYLRSQHAGYTASRISGFNSQSINSHKKLGATTFQKVVFLIFGPLQITLSLRSPWCHLSTPGSKPPVFHVGL
jgi:hypothetical protein